MSLHPYRLARVYVRQALADQQWMVSDYELFTGPVPPSDLAWIQAHVFAQLTKQLTALHLTMGQVQRYLERSAALESLAVAAGLWLSTTETERIWLASIQPAMRRMAA